MKKITKPTIFYTKKYDRRLMQDSIDRNEYLNIQIGILEKKIKRLRQANKYRQLSIHKIYTDEELTKAALTVQRKDIKFYLAYILRKVLKQIYKNI